MIKKGTTVLISEKGQPARFVVVEDIVQSTDGVVCIVIKPVPHLKSELKVT